MAYVAGEEIHDEEAAFDINSVPTFLLQAVLSFLVLRPIRIDAPLSQWASLIQLMTARRCFADDAVSECVQEDIPSFLCSIGGRCTSWTSLLAALRGGGRSSWHVMQPLRAVRGKTRFSTSLQSAPKTSGSTLCALGCGKLVLFGGRCSDSGDTLAASYVVTVPARLSGVVQWEKLHCGTDPPARCYHSAVRRIGEPAMFVFGGAGSRLFGDTWLLHLTSVAADQLGAMASCGVWESCDNQESAKTPSARSSHILSSWSSDLSCAVLHGGLGELGVLSDTWLLHPSGHWLELQTQGPRVARAHHCGGVVKDSLLVYSGQDESYLTSGCVFSLDLLLAVWHEVCIENGPSPRIDASAAVVETAGLLVFGGVGTDFEFEEPTPWMVPVVSQAQSNAYAMTRRGKAPCARACSSISADGLCVYVCGGFDGEQDLGDRGVWNLFQSASKVALHLSLACFCCHK